MKHLTITNLCVRLTKFSIEAAVLEKDRRNISTLTPYLAPNYIEKAGEFIWGISGKVFITTGFFVNGSVETDGLLGAIVLGKALFELGYEVHFVLDKYALPFIDIPLPFEKEVIDFPITDHVDSKKIAEELLAKYEPSAVIAIERCGMTKDGTYYNCRGVDISEFTAKMDYLFQKGNTIGIGDGGNEIGMGNLEKIIRDKLEVEPSITKVEHLILASVSNWGAYGLVAYLSKLSGNKLLPQSKEIENYLKLVVEKGAVDGFSGTPEMKVDGFYFEQIEQIINKLQTII